MDVTVIFTCFNRKEKSIKCIKSLVENNEGINFHFIIVDDNSYDGTKDAILSLNYDTEVLSGTGLLFWAGGMRKGINRFLSHKDNSQYVLFINDDVKFYDCVITKMIDESIENGDAVMVGATCDEEGQLTYGAMKLIQPRKRGFYRQVHPNENAGICDTFNCNCVLLRSEVIRDIGNFDPVYSHSLADMDYGLTLRRHGYLLYSTSFYVGECSKNSIKGTWKDTSLSRTERLKKKESPKGVPYKEWFYFMKKNFGVLTAIKYSITPYIRILLGK